MNRRQGYQLWVTGSGGGQGIFHCRHVRMLHAVNTRHGLPDRIGCHGIRAKRSILPWQNLLHAGVENLFSGLSLVLSSLSQDELMALMIPLGCADEYDISYQELVRTFLS
jgi:hypothetical protein